MPVQHLAAPPFFKLLLYFRIHCTKGTSGTATCSFIYITDILALFSNHLLISEKTLHFSHWMLGHIKIPPPLFTDRCNCSKHSNNNCYEVLSMRHAGIYYSCLRMLFLLLYSESEFSCFCRPSLWNPLGVPSNTVCVFHKTTLCPPLMLCHVGYQCRIVLSGAC